MIFIDGTLLSTLSRTKHTAQEDHFSLCYSKYMPASWSVNQIISSHGRKIKGLRGSPRPAFGHPLPWCRHGEKELFPD
jgi:hypothetical protein